MTDQDNRPMEPATLRQKAETLAREQAARTPEDSAALSPGEIRKTLHELRVHQIELEMQNEELRTAQAQIEAGRDRYFDLYDQAPLGYCTLSEQGLILEANLTAATLLGMTRGALIKQPISRFILKDDQDIYYLHRKKLFETGEPLECELRLVKPDGALIWAHLMATAAQAESGAPVCRLAISDITERKRAAEALREKTKFLQNIIDTTSDLVAVTDMEGNFKFIGPSFIALGYDPDSLVGRNVMEFVHPDDYQKTATAFAEFLANREDGRKVEYRYRRRDGNYLWFETVGKFILDDAGYPKEILFSSRDFTAHKRVEGELKRIEWMLSRKPVPDIDARTEPHDQGYGDLTELNRDGIILKFIGQERLKSFANDYLELLGTSSAIYEVNGDYAFGIFASGWCRMMDRASRKLCDTPDNAEALNSGRWLCHESCWNDCAQEAIAKRAEVDIECNGGIRMYAVPIFAGGNVIGVINFGYGDPPKDPEKLKMLGDVYHLNHDDLVRKATAYDSRPLYIIEMAKKRLNSTAKLIGSMVETTQAMAALRESENQIRSIFRTAPVGIGSVVNRVLIKVNNRLCEMVGYDETELVGQNARMLYPSDEDFEFVGREKYAQIADHGTGMVETRWQKKDGTIMEVLISSTPADLQDQSKEVTFTALDITESKQAEKTLKSNYALLQIAGQTADFGGWSVDLKNNICTWSDAVADIHELPHGYALPVQEGINFYAPEWREKITQLFRACAKEGLPYDEEMEIITQKGKRVWIRTTGKAVKNEKDKIIKVQGSFQDITDRKQVEQVLVEQKDLLAAIYRNAPLVIMVVNAERRIQQVNGFAAQFAGRDAEEMLGLRGGEALRCLHVLDDPRGCGFGEFCHQCVIRNTVLETLETGKTNLQIEAPYYFKGQDNKTRELQFLMSTTPIEVKGEHMALVTLQDITEGKQNEAEKRKLQAQLLQAQKMESVGRLAGGVAHDFNNMLGVILGHTELAMLRTEEDHDLYSDLKEIQTAAKRSADITRQLLAFARKQTISPRQLDLNVTVESMLNMLRRLIGEDIDLVWKPSVHLWPVKMDPSQIDQILANLCINARDAIAGVGKLTIETGIKSFDEEYCRENPGFIPGEFVLLAVSDNGCGMDKDILDSLFEPFFTTKEVGKGTGLGLATVYGIIKQNNGFINVYSEPGQGSTFKIYLSRFFDEDSVSAAEPKKKTAAGGTETILLVEDEPSILRMTRMMLEMKGYSVLSAATPVEAIEMARNHTDKVHLLMTDVVMPGMNARDLATKIKALYPEIRLLFMSGYTANVIVHQGVLDEGVAFIQKPFSMADMTEKVRVVLDIAADKNHG